MINSLLTSSFNYVQAYPILALVVATWVFVWKGIALWKAARLYHRWWFVILVALNTAGIVEIAYIFLIARPAERSLETEEG